LAVESATRDCELTNWKSGRALETLAAACAESGDFDTAVNWQQEAVQQITSRPGIWQDSQDGLALYKAGKPYREDR